MSDQFTRWGTMKHQTLELALIERGHAPTIHADQVVQLSVRAETTAIELGLVELTHEGPSAVNIVARLRLPNNTIRIIANEIDRQTQSQTPPDPEKVN